uniref:Uncharacterized protein n=1 Tax=Romanomermis culicivorax TaxID=13658 RepID=A0A915LAA1_ROMCU
MTHEQVGAIFNFGNQTVQIANYLARMDIQDHSRIRVAMPLLSIPNNNETGIKYSQSTTSKFHEIGQNFSPVVAANGCTVQPFTDQLIIGKIWPGVHQCLPEACMVTGMDEIFEITIEPAIVNPTSQQFPLVIMNSTNNAIKLKKNELIGKIAMLLEGKPADSTTSLDKQTNLNFDICKFKQQITKMVQKSTLTPEQQCKLEKFLISNRAIFSLEIEYVPRRENAFADFLSRKGEDQTKASSNTTTSTKDQNSKPPNIDAVETRAQARQKMVAEPSDHPDLVHDLIQLSTLPTSQIKALVGHLLKNK